MDATEEFFDRLGRRGYEPRLAIFSGVVRFDIEQDGQVDQWFVRSTSGRIEVSRTDGPPDASLRVGRALFNAAIGGQRSVQTATLAGDLVFSGSAVGTAALKRLFGRPNLPRWPPPANPRARVAAAQNLVTILDGDAFIVTDTSGDVDASSLHPGGFFYHDTRLLSTWILTINGQRLAPLSVDNVHYYEVLFSLVASGDPASIDSALSVTRERTLCDGLCETLTILNYSADPVDLSVRVEAGADFADFLEVGQPVTKKGNYYREVGDDRLLLGYERQRFHRETTISATRPARFDEQGLTMTVHIEPQESWSTQLTAIPRRGATPREVERPTMVRRTPSYFHSGVFPVVPPMVYGVVTPSHIRCATRPSIACGRLWQWSIQIPGLSATKAMS
jgi:hypothetical protein